MKPVIGYIALAIGVILFFTVLYINGGFANKARPFAKYTILSASWEAYKKNMINGDGRVVDYAQNAVTTSEAQSYAMLRAVWVDDKPEFDKVWSWTKDNLQKRGDHLFGWHWGQRADSSYGFLDGGGDNSATDADSDIALALILASRRWRVDQYTGEAMPVLADIWNEETATVSGKMYLTAGNWAQSQQEVIINPSYFAPYAWRIFAQVDKQHDWNSLIGPAYTLLEQTTTDPLDKSTGALPPDWVKMSKADGKLAATNIPDHTTNYGFDAMRVPWRVGLDYAWNNNPEALSYLAHFKVLADSFSQSGAIASVYAHDGTVVNSTEVPAMYATALGAFTATNQDLAKKIYESKVASLYSNDTGEFDPKLGYYDQNWLWFGTALYLNYLDHY